jgi:hypothetical protein
VVVGRDPGSRRCAGQYRLAGLSNTEIPGCWGCSGFQTWKRPTSVPGCGAPCLTSSTATGPATASSGSSPRRWHLVGFLQDQRRVDSPRVSLTEGIVAGRATSQRPRQGSPSGGHCNHSGRSGQTRRPAAHRAGSPRRAPRGVAVLRGGVAAATHAASAAATAASHGRCASAPDIHFRPSSLNESGMLSRLPNGSCHDRSSAGDGVQDGQVGKSVTNATRVSASTYRCSYRQAPSTRRSWFGRASNPSGVHPRTAPERDRRRLIGNVATVGAD